MKYKFLIQITGFIFIGGTLLRGEPASAITTFQCVNADSSYVTIAVSSSGNKTRPLIVWNSITFAQSSDTPKPLCERVTERLNNDTARIFTQSYSQIDSSVAEIAKLVTVRILNKLGAGSGVIVDRQGQTYTVLTCDHVANPSPDDRFTILTPDGQTHSAYRQRLPSLEGVDLALVQFESRSPYRVAVLGNSKNLSVGERVYASGFPNYQYQGSNSVEETLNWGLRAYRLTTGTIAMLLSNQSLPRGYQLGYSNDIEPGMSGGPVLDREGRLIGINGRGKHPIQGIDAFTLADGTTPSPELFKRMEALSWAVPISSFMQRSDQLPHATGVENNFTLPPLVTDSPSPVPQIVPPKPYPNGSLSL